MVKGNRRGRRSKREGDKTETEKEDRRDRIELRDRSGREDKMGRERRIRQKKKDER